MPRILHALLKGRKALGIILTVLAIAAAALELIQQRMESKNNPLIKQVYDRMDQRLDTTDQFGGPEGPHSEEGH